MTHEEIRRSVFNYTNNPALAKINTDLIELMERAGKAFEAQIAEEDATDPRDSAELFQPTARLFVNMILAEAYNRNGIKGGEDIMESILHGFIPLVEAIEDQIEFQDAFADMPAFSD